MGKPHVVSENLSSMNFSAANSKRKGLYFSSVFDVLLDAEPIGWHFRTTLPLGSVYSNLWDNTAPNASWDPSVVTMKGVPSHLGPHSTGFVVISALRLMKV